MQRSILIALAAFLIAAPVYAEVSVKNPWVRATVKEQKATGAFMQLTAQTDMRLVEVRSPVAKIVEVHEMSMVDNVMKMRAVSGGLELPAGKTVELRPGSYHVMLIDLNGQVKEGDVVPLTLVVEGKDRKRETIEVNATARPLTAMSAPAMQHQQ